MQIIVITDITDIIEEYFQEHQPSKAGQASKIMQGKNVRDFIDRQINFRPGQGWSLGFRNYFCLMINILLQSWLGSI